MEILRLVQAGQAESQWQVDDCTPVARIPADDQSVAPSCFPTVLSCKLSMHPRTASNRTSARAEGARQAARREERYITQLSWSVTWLIEQKEISKTTERRAEIKAEWFNIDTTTNFTLRPLYPTQLGGSTNCGGRGRENKRTEHCMTSLFTLRVILRIITSFWETELWSLMTLL